MADVSWLLQIYDVTDVVSQQRIVGVLRGVEALVVAPVTDGSDVLVVVESPDPALARSVFKLVSAVDVSARLVHTTMGAPRSFAGMRDDGAGYLQGRASREAEIGEGR